ncbi:hypothetical protein CHARACLAT_002657 [Characodon lateralis]|uniref:Uncharacterized protein n=1 Tax=Characodon lateralis TaxID=208331 RepID=A0ABU7DDF1_9TELE|nr:hypothetical protein [Characodon lateralis]
MGEAQPGGFHTVISKALNHPGLGGSGHAGGNESVPSSETTFFLSESLATRVREGATGCHKDARGCETSCKSLYDATTAAASVLLWSSQPPLRRSSQPSRSFVVHENVKNYGSGICSDLSKSNIF